MQSLFINDRRRARTAGYAGWDGFRRRPPDFPVIGGEQVAGAGERLAVETRSRPRRSSSREGLEAFQETKHVHMESRIERKEWWYPYKEYGAPPGDGAGS
jgi:hypothetical protein